MNILWNIKTTRDRQNDKKKKTKETNKRGEKEVDQLTHLLITKREQKIQQVVF